ncbi:MAG: HNH endonuclease [Anaerolineae bacterium]
MRRQRCRVNYWPLGMPLVVDHILPRSLGGSDEPENLCAACYRCNEYKGARPTAVTRSQGHGFRSLTREFKPGVSILPGPMGTLTSLV